MVIRHRFTIRDLGLLIAFMLVAGYLAFSIDIFENESRETVHEETVELDESLALGGLLTIGLLVFATRRYQEQKRETRRRIAAEHQVRELAFQDGLTGLANRRQFEDALRAAIASPPGADTAHALFMLDLNGFKQVNDVYGHGTGDEVLVIVAQRLRAAVRAEHLVARFGGDEFAILACHVAGSEAATSIALRVIQSLRSPIAVGRTRHEIGVGIGITLLPGDAHTIEDAVRKADVALYRAKAERRSAMRFFEPDMDRRVRERDRMERDLREAFAAGLIEPRYKPSVDLQTGQVVGFDVAPYWLHPELGEVAAERFLPIAENVGLIHDLGTQLLRSACATARHWPARTTLGYAISAGQLKDSLLGSRIRQILGESAFPPRRLEVQISEAALVADVEAAQEALSGLRGEGVKIALANFGTGYSSLYHLRNFKLDKIKIDRSFIESMLAKSESASVINALVGLGHGLGVTVMAEGVADPEQQAALRGTGVEQGQGGLYGAALGAEATRALFPRRPTLDAA